MAKKDNIDPKGAKELGDNISDAASNIDGLLKALEELNKTLGDTGEAGKDLGDNLSKNLKKSEYDASSYGKTLNGIGKIFKGVKAASDVFVSTAKTGFNLLGKAMAGVAGVIIGITKNLISMVNPIKLASVAVAAMEEGFQKGQQAAERVSQQNVDLARTLGVAQSKANELASEARSIGSAMGITGGQATAAAGEIIGAMSGI